MVSYDDTFEEQSLLNFDDFHFEKLEHDYQTASISEDMETLEGLDMVMDSSAVSRNELVVEVEDQGIASPQV